MRSIFVTAFAILLLSAAPAWAQTPSSPHVPNNPLPDWVGENARKRQTIDRMMIPKPGDRAVATLPGNRARAGRPSGGPLTPEEIEAMRTAEEESRIKFGPGRDYYLEFQDYLNANRDARIERIFEFADCGTGKVVTLAEIERCRERPFVRQGGSFLSFRCTDEYFVECGSSRISDLRFNDDSFKVGDGVIQGIIANIGDVKMDSLTATHPAMKYISDFDFKQTVAKIAEQDTKLAAGIGAEGYRFSNSVPVSLNSTYVMRSVLYRNREEGQFYMPPRGSDVRIAFRVIGIEPDGSAVILVKELGREYPRRQIGK